MKPATIRVKKDIFRRARLAMVREQLVKRGITQRPLLHAMAIVPRHIFIEEALYAQAYADCALPIGEKQTISQPYTIARMIESLVLKGAERVLEIGSGSGYQSAVLSMMAERVFSMERISRIAARARKILDGLLCSNVVVRVGDGTRGWPEEAPFDAIIVSAFSPGIPPACIDQLAQGGRLVIPVGGPDTQKLVLITRRKSGISKKVLGDCRFVRLVGKDGWREGDKVC